MNWLKVRLGDHVEVGAPKVDPSSIRQPVVEHFSLPAFDGGSRPEIVDPATIRSTKQLLDREYVLVSKLNPGTPRVWRVREPNGRIRLASTEFLALRPKTADLDMDFLRYACETPAFTDAMASQANGTSSSHQRISASAVLRFELNLPPPDEQVAIAHVLGAIDNKISGNTEAIGKCEDLLAESYSASLFDEAVPVRLDSIASVTKGASYTSADLRAGDGGGFLFSLKCFARDGSLAENGLKPYHGDHKESQRISAGDVVVAQTDLTQDASVVGRALRIPEGLVGDPIVASLDVAIVRSLGDAIPQTVLAAALRTDSFREHCRSRSSGTTVLHLRAGAIESFPLPVPSAAQISALADAALSTFALTDGLRTERRLLVGLRRTLLPELLAGFRRIRKAS